MIDRWLYPHDEFIPTDQYGLLDKSLNSSKILPARELLTMHFAIVVGNSGMGKTMLIDAFMAEDCNFEKIDCEYISLADERIIESTYGNVTTPITIFFDQVENKENQIKVRNYLRHFRRSLQNCTNPSGCQVRFYFFLKSSEFLDELRNTLCDCYHDLKIETPKPIVWRLSPFSFDEIIQLAIQKEISDLTQFKEKIIRSKLIYFCSNSLLAENIVQGYKDSHYFENPDQLWEKSINRLFSPLNVEDEQYISLEKAIQCAGWIAFCLFFQGKNSVWMGDQTNVEERYLSYNDIKKNKQFSPFEIGKTLSTKIFNAPPGEGYARQFTHHLYQSFVAAEFMSATHEKYYSSMLFNPELDQIIPKYEELAAFLANKKPSVAKMLLKYQPNLLILFVTKINLIPPINTLKGLLSSLDNLSYEEVSNIVDKSNLLIFNDHECSQYIKDLLSNDISMDYWTAWIIVNICITCSFSNIADDLIKYVKNEGHSPDIKRIIIRGINKLATYGQREALIELLDRNLENSSEDLLGALLGCLWPGVISIQSVVNHLSPPKHKFNFSDYQYFLRYHLIYNLSKITVEEAPFLLQWCIDSYPSFMSHSDSLLEVIQKIYGYYWKWANVPQIADKYVEAYLLQMYEGLFLVPEPKNNCEYLPLEFGNSESRFIILDKLFPLMPENFKIWQLIQDPYPLLNFKDWTLIIERIKSTDTPIASIWIEAIKIFIYRNSLSDSMWKDIDTIHGLFPTLIMTSEDFKKVIIEREREQDILSNTRNSDGIARKKIEAQEKKKRSILDSIWLDNAYSQFESISYWVLTNFGESIGIIESITILNSEAWNSFDASIQERIITLAFDYLDRSNFPGLQERKFQIGAAIASVLLESKDNDRFQKIPEERWEIFGVEVLSAYSCFSRELEPIIQYFSYFSDSYGKSYLNLLEHSANDAPSFSLGNLFQYLSPNYQEITIEYLFKNSFSPEFSSDVLLQLPRESIQINATHYFMKLIEKPNFKYEDIQVIPYFKAMAIINPNEFFKLVVELSMKNTEWGKTWTEQVARCSYVDQATNWDLQNCDLNILTDYYIWLETQYPADNKPQHEGSYTPDIIDEIYDFKASLLSLFINENAPQAFQCMKRIKEAFPNNYTINKYLLKSRKNYLKNQIHYYDIEELLSIIADNNGTKNIINNDKELLFIILENLKNYEKYLHKDCGAIRDLWNIQGNEQPVHKSEEDFSDHIKRYLDFVFQQNGIIINREVQIKRKLFKDGQPGARTDLWIQAISKNGETITLCIEVKGNWNQSAQNALTAQLIGNYMNGPDRTATAGILLVGWFGNNLGGNWKSKEEAIQDLSSQVEAAKIDNWLVEKCIIDCTIH